MSKSINYFSSSGSRCYTDEVRELDMPEAVWPSQLVVASHCSIFLVVRPQMDVGCTGVLGRRAGRLVSNE